jgi:hypothetical protein
MLIGPVDKVLVINTGTEHGGVVGSEVTIGILVQVVLGQGFYVLTVHVRQGSSLAIGSLMDQLMNVGILASSIVLVIENVMSIMKSVCSCTSLRHRLEQAFSSDSCGRRVEDRGTEGDLHIPARERTYKSDYFHIIRQKNHTESLSALALTSTPAFSKSLNNLKPDLLLVELKACQKHK